jgi:hypothetical protein
VELAKTAVYTAMTARTGIHAINAQIITSCSTTRVFKLALKNTTNKMDIVFLAKTRRIV